MKWIKAYMEHIRESQEGPEELSQRLIAKLDIDAPPDIEEVKDLIKAGADLEARDGDAWTPLHVATYWGHTEAAKALIGAGADLDARDKDGRTPLHRAALHERIEAVKALIEAGADLEARDKDAWTPLHVATYWGHTEAAKVLILAGADPKPAFDSMEELTEFFSGDVGWVPEEAMEKMKKRSRARGAFGRF